MSIYNTLTQETSIEVIVNRLSELVNNCSQDSLGQLKDSIADSLLQCDIETQIYLDACNDTNKEQRENFVKLVKELLSAKIINESIVKERFEIESLADIGLVADKRQAQIVYNRLRTKLYYKQNKYNLLREENEGFARLLTQLTQLCSTNIQETIDNMTTTIGRYNIDPNRVLDLVLEVFESNGLSSDTRPFIQLIKSFYNDATKIRQIIILKLGFYTNSKDELNIIPQSFYRIIAILIRENMLELDELYPHLLPTDEKLLDFHKKLVDEAKSESKRYAMAFIGGNGTEANQETVRDKLTEEERHFLLVDNQKINICSHLIQICDWQNALILSKKLPEFYCFSAGKVAQASCQLITYLIDPLYHKYCGLPQIIKKKISPIPKLNFGPEQLTDPSQLQEQLFPLLHATGPFISCDSLLLTKLIRLLKGILVEKDDDQQDLISKQTQLYYDILDVINECILPAITLSGCNCCLSRELWSIMKHLSYHTRYKLYFNWKDEGLNQHLLRAKGHVLLSAKHHMKRLSKDTVRTTGRQLGKLCYSTPVITLNYVLLQVQSYDNLIGPLIDALKYLPSLALDVLVWSVIELLADPHRNRQSADGMAIAPWLTSLSTFSANFILKYKVDFTGFLQFIANRLKTGKSLDLVLLADLIQKMTGIETTQDITDEKIEALLGGEILRTEGAYFNQGKNTRKSAARLKDALIESRLAMPLCILMAQLRDCLFFSQQDESHLKLVGKLYDQCQETLVQYGVFLSLNLSIDDYINFLPPLEILMNEEKLNPDAAFFLARPMLMYKIKSRFDQLKSNNQETEKEALFIQAANEVIDPLIVVLEPIIKSNYGQFSAKLFILFWTLSMSDLEVPTSCYEREIFRLKSCLSDNEDDPKRRKENEKLTTLIIKLKCEQSEQAEHCRLVNCYLESEKKNIFLEKVACNSELTHQFIQHCLFARSILTANDAIYSSRFILTLHELKIEGFSTLICYDRLLCDITYMMGACTENEANHYGRFLCNILKTITLWHSNSTIYEQRCGCYPGFVFRVPDEKDPKTNLEYENFRHVCHKWHYRLTKALVLSLESNSYVQIRNALIVLRSIIEYFPVISSFGRAIERRVEEVRLEEKDKRHDLYALATGYFGRLESKKTTYIPESEFHHVEDSKSEANNIHSKKDDSLTLPKPISNNNNSHQSNGNSSENSLESKKRTSHERASSSSRPSSSTRSPPSHSRERHSSSSSRKRLKK